VEALSEGDRQKNRIRYTRARSLSHHAAKIHEIGGGCDVLQSGSTKCTTIKVFSGDAGYRGTAADFVENRLGLKLHISKKIKDTFAVLPTRWIVEPTFARLAHYRRLSKDYEIFTPTAENMLCIAILRITVVRCV
jgi:putative transposase